MTCRHARTATTGFVPSCGIDAPLLAGRFVQCIDCREVLPLGPASDTPEVKLEIVAAEVAWSELDGEERDILADGDALNFWAGWADCEQLDPYSWEPKMYAAGALSREIHGEEGA